MNFQTILILVLVFVIVYFVIDKLHPINKKEEKEEKTVSDYSKSYQKTYLLSKNEYSEYKKLKKYTDEHNMLICPKVRLLDIIQPVSGKDYASLRAKIQSKHVDFVITDAALHILAVLELDDTSHDTEKRKERDTFVDEILQSVGYPVIRTRGITDEILNKAFEPMQTVHQNQAERNTVPQI